jgi:hypothetical protein
MVILAQPSDSASCQVRVPGRMSRVLVQVMDVRMVGEMDITSVQTDNQDSISHKLIYIIRRCTCSTKSSSAINLTLLSLPGAAQAQAIYLHMHMRVSCGRCAMTFPATKILVNPQSFRLHLSDRLACLV